MTHRRPHLYGIFAVTIAVVAIAFIFLLQRDTAPRVGQPSPAVSALIASHWAHPGHALIATFDSQSSEISKIAGLSSLEKGVFKNNNPDRKLEQNQEIPLMGALEPSSLELAKESLRKKNFSRVIEFCKDALARQSKDLPQVKALYSRALRGQAAMFKGKDANKAEIILRKAVEVDPQSFEAYFDLGKLYTQSQDHPKAIESYQKAIGLNPRSAKTAFNLGFVYATTQDYVNAEELFHRAAELKPPFLDKAIFNLAMVQQKQGKEQECAKNLEKALMINPDNHRARKYIEQLTSNSGVSR